MEEDLNENELEERFYSMLHYGDGTQDNVKVQEKDALAIVESAPRSTVRRYWRTSEHEPLPSPFQKVNAPKPPVSAKPPAPTKSPAPAKSPAPTKSPAPAKTPTTDHTRPKQEKRYLPPPPEKLAIFQSPVPEKNTIEIIDHVVDIGIVELETSDEDEVVEVELPPKPTITIESSDDETAVEKQVPTKNQTLKLSPQHKNEREKSASPVPSVVSSVSDEFIRSDCIAFNISSQRPDNHSFDFSLHGADLIDQSTPAKKKKKKKSKEVTSTPNPATTTSDNSVNKDVCFATPKTKAKNKKQKQMSYTVSEISVPSADIYDSDSNQSSIYTNKRVLNPYSVTEKSLPSVDVYESDSNQSESVKDVDKTKQNSSENNSNVTNSDTTTQKSKETSRTKKNSVSRIDSTIDLTDDLEVSDIQENIMIGNVSGFTENNDYEDVPALGKNSTDEIKLGSTNVPAILYEDLDFDNLGKGVCKNRRYSLTTLRHEMEKFYNESWGGENFNHREIQKYMSRDKNLWAIDPKDRMPSYNISKRKPTCNYCNRPGHRDDMCRLKPSVCFMCGTRGHTEPRCPRKICVNCAAPADLYTTICRHCCHWPRLVCAQCGQNGHPDTHCPDLWRRYHNTTSVGSEMEESRGNKKHWQLYCSGCARRGHLVHTCRLAVPFTALPLHSPYVAQYRPLYAADRRPSDHKRRSGSPVRDETQPKRRPAPPPAPPPAPLSELADPAPALADAPAPDFIPVGLSNRDNKGRVIQDNRVSDTSDAVTSARVYVSGALSAALAAEPGRGWLADTAARLAVTAQAAPAAAYLTVRGRVADQQAFQRALQQWHAPAPPATDAPDSDADPGGAGDNIPKNRNNVLRKLSKALQSLKGDIGEPNALYKELTYLENRHLHLLQQKAISPKQLANNRSNMNDMLKKLNMILLGQAGLADGAAHVAQLVTLQRRLMQCRQKRVPQDLRVEIGEHYHCIFSAAARDDYGELIQTFNGAQHCKINKKTKPFKLTPREKKFKVIPVQRPQPLHNQNGPMNRSEDPPARTPLVDTALNKLAFYHKRLLRARPADSALKKTRVQLVRKLHSHINSLTRNRNMSTKALKKMKKVQEQAQMFLNNH